MIMPQGMIEPKTLRKSLSPRKTKSGLKTKKQPGLFDFITAPLNEVAPLEWLPGPYQKQIKAAKPVRLSRPRVKRAKGKTKKTKAALH